MRLEIGPGAAKLGPDWTTVSAAPGRAVDFLCEWGIDDLPFPDEHFDEVYSSHCIEHVSWLNAESALMEARRVLKPGGVVEIHTVDFAKLVEFYRSRTCDQDDVPHFMVALSHRLFNYPKRVNDRACANWHHSMYDREYLGWLLDRCGFMDIHDAGEPRGEEKHGVVSFGLKAVRR